MLEMHRPVGRLLFILSLLALAAGLGSGLGSTPALADKRVALVVGNSNYRSVDRLDNPAKDATLIADTLRDLGFTLVGGGPQLDLDRSGFRRAVQSFGAQLDGAEVALFYYAGHGLQVRGNNYLVPVDANPTQESDVDVQMLDTNLVLHQMEDAGKQLNIIILDACRTNPFGRSLAVALGSRVRDIADGGLAQMQAPTGTLISFATQPGNVALDGTGGHSPYSRALAATLRKPGLGLLDAFNDVGIQVQSDTRDRQIPWVSYSPIPRPFYFTPASGTAAVATLPAREQPAAAPPARTQLAALPPPAKAIAPLPVPAAKLLAPADAKALKAGDAFKECSRCPVMVAVPPGTFTMGSPPSEVGRDNRSGSEGPQQKITIGKMFAVGRTEVSWDEWGPCVADGACADRSDSNWGAGKRPVINVSWDDAKAYVKWLSKQTGATYRLLSDAEREYIARGCSDPCPSTPFWFGSNISRDYANYNSEVLYAGVGEKLPQLKKTVETDQSVDNGFHLQHVLGNVREWVEDCWNPKLDGQPSDGSARTTTGDCLSHVVRGGSWADRPEDLRSAKRSFEPADERNNKLGFRVARDLLN